MPKSPKQAYCTKFLLSTRMQPAARRPRSARQPSHPPEQKAASGGDGLYLSTALVQKADSWLESPCVTGSPAGSCSPVLAPEDRGRPVGAGPKARTATPVSEARPSTFATGILSRPWVWGASAPHWPPPSPLHLLLRALSRGPQRNAARTRDRAASRGPAGLAPRLLPRRPAGARVPLTQLSEQVEEDKGGGQQVAAAPGAVDVVPLLAPLEPHADAVLQERADQAEAGHVRQVLLCDAQELQAGKAMVRGSGTGWGEVWQPLPARPRGRGGRIRAPCLEERETSGRPPTSSSVISASVCVSTTVITRGTAAGQHVHLSQGRGKPDWPTTDSAGPRRSPGPGLSTAVPLPRLAPRVCRGVSTKAVRACLASLPSSCWDSPAPTVTETPADTAASCPAPARPFTMADYGTRTKPRHERHSGEPHSLAPPKHSKQRDKGKDTCDTVTAGTGEKERVPAHVTRVSAARVRRAPMNLTLEGTLSVTTSQAG